MLNQLQLRAHRLTSLAIVAGLLILAPLRAFAQTPQESSALGDTFKGVVFDPSTYAPAIVAYDATVRDWNSSQVFFRNGYFENNARFTISGRPRDVPISYAAGRNRILTDALVNLQMSVANNVVDRLLERTLIRRYPQHRRLVRTVGWIERLSFASFLSYRMAAAHYRQTADNIVRAQQLGFSQ